MATALKLPETFDDLADASPEQVRETMLERARALIPVLRERAAATEKLRRIPDETVRDIIDAGLMRPSVAREYGGYAGVEYDLTLEIAMELGRGCPSTAWCYCIWANHNLTISMMQEETRRAFYANGPDVICSTARMCIHEEMEVVEGGVRLSGQYNFSSGCHHSEWFIILTKGWIGLLVPRRDLEIQDNWDVMGLKGTGSHGIVLKDVFVPTTRIWGLFDSMVMNPPAFARNQRFSDAVDGPMLAYTALSTVVGAALGSVDEFIRSNKGKLTNGGGVMNDYGAGDAVATHIRHAKSYAEAEAAQRLMLDDCRWLLGKARRGEQIDAENRARIRRNQAFISELAVSAATRLFDALGGRGLIEGNAQQRYFRDAVAASHHTTLPKDRLYENYGAQMFGFRQHRDHTGDLYHPSLVTDLFADAMA